MFKVEKGTTSERYCPKGHQPIPNFSPEDDPKVKFCHVCGAPIQERQVTYDVAYCANCNNQVYPYWNYCPYCGQAREE